MHVVRLKLLGQPTATYENVKRLIVERAGRESIDIEIEEIQSWEKIIEEDVPAIPTVRINQHRSYTLEQHGDVKEFVNKVCEGLVIEADQMNIRRILVATDFSDASHNAMKFALKLAGSLEGKITLVHAVETVSMSDDGALFVNTKFEERKREALNTFVNDVMDKNVPGVVLPTISQEVILGNLVDALVEATSSYYASLLVMGSSSGGKGLKKWFGSATTELANKSPVPVFIIPRNGFLYQTYANCLCL